MHPAERILGGEHRGGIQTAERPRVESRSEAMDYGLSTAAILDDTCGNQIMIYQENKK